MSDGGFLGAPQPEQAPQPAAPETPETETPQESAEVDEVALAERKALKEMEAAAQEAAKDDFLQTAQEAAPTSTVASPSAGQTAAPTQETAPPVEKDRIMLEVEKILEDGLGEYVPDMPDEAREKFIKKGGEVTGQISGMVRSMNVQVKRVVELIRDWLLSIPGVNRYFVEQEAKIKTDRIVDLVEAHRQERSSQIPKA